MHPVVAGAVGAAAALGADVLARRRFADQRLALTAAGLVGAAAVYPLGRRGRFGDGLERATLVASTALVGASAALPSKRARLLVAAGWLSHAAFDAAFAQRSAGSRIPSWYPPMCAGYDAMVALRLAAT
jgi:hypothetical protein